MEKDPRKLAKKYKKNKERERGEKSMLISEDNYILKKKLKEAGNQNAFINEVIIFLMKKEIK